MSERVFRFVLGASLLIILFFRSDTLVYAYIGIQLFEGITNWRIPILVSKIRYGKNYNPAMISSPGCSSIPFDAERALRLIVAMLLILSAVLYPASLWFIPWFVGFMLFMAGITNICPLAMSLRWAGFR